MVVRERTPKHHWTATTLLDQWPAADVTHQGHSKDDQTETIRLSGGLARKLKEVSNKANDPGRSTLRCDKESTTSDNSSSTVLSGETCCEARGSFVAFGLES
jgi:hypothetical protein